MASMLPWPTNRMGVDVSFIKRWPSAAMFISVSAGIAVISSVVVFLLEVSGELATTSRAVRWNLLWLASAWLTVSAAALRIPSRFRLPGALIFCFGGAFVATQLPSISEAYTFPLVLAFLVSLGYAAFKSWPVSRLMALGLGCPVAAAMLFLVSVLVLPWDGVLFPIVPSAIVILGSTIGLGLLPIVAWRQPRTRGIDSNARP